MSRVHKNEMIRFANSEESTRLWYKTSKGEWKLIIFPQWVANTTYIVDDEYADIRKQFIDDPSKVEVSHGELWAPSVAGNIEEFTELLECQSHRYRIKPEGPKYEWQWVGKLNDGSCYMTTDHYEEGHVYVLRLIKYKPSKRIVSTDTKSHCQG